jgi:predicted adenylyl cyclase CyaB
LPRNIEIKARIDATESLAPLAAALADKGPVVILQDDTFFGCAAGRLKLRTFADGTGELIFYRRNDQHGPKESFYLRSPTSAPESLREALSLAYGVVGRVRKHRTLYLAGRTRIHLDKVDGLGDFLELEVVLREAEQPADGVLEAQQLMRRLGIETNQLLDDAYVDLLENASA